MTAIIHHVQQIFRTYLVPQDDALMDKLAALSYESKWSNSSVWHSHATQLDSTKLYYFLPDRYEALKLLTELDYDYVPMTIGDINIYAMGICYKPQPFGPFMNRTMSKNLAKYLPSLSLQALYELRFAMILNQNTRSSRNYSRTGRKAMQMLVHTFLYIVI